MCTGLDVFMANADFSSAQAHNTINDFITFNYITLANNCKNIDWLKQLI